MRADQETKQKLGKFVTLQHMTSIMADSFRISLYNEADLSSFLMPSSGKSECVLQWRNVRR